MCLLRRVALSRSALQPPSEPVKLHFPWSRVELGRQVLGDSDRSPPKVEGDSILEDAAFPKLTVRSPVVSAHAEADGRDLLDVRLGAGGIAGLWNRALWLAGAGDPGALRDAQDVRAEVDRHVDALKACPDRALAQQARALRETVQAGTRSLREKVDAQAKAARAAEVADAPEAALLARQWLATKKQLRTVEQELLVEARAEIFALAAEASSRRLGLRPYPVQVIAAALLSEGKIVEQYTGEGKTLTSVLHAAQAALAGRGVHVATASNYLAKRDAIEMAPIYNALGFTVAALTPDGAVKLTADGEAISVSRQAAYQADIVYATVEELGFDHLRDQLELDESRRVQRGHATLIMDEVDSLLIDDARTPLIISGSSAAADADAWKAVTDGVASLREEHIEFDRSEGWAMLTPEGEKALAATLGVRLEALSEDPELARMAFFALYARALMVPNIDYVVERQADEIRLLGKNGDEMEGRRFRGGLHQAIEAREGISIKPEAVALNTTTIRNYAALYDRSSGLTGTAESSARLFRDVYGFDVVRVPTHRKFRRDDRPTRLFATIADKAAAAKRDVLDALRQGRPVLMGSPDERSALWLDHYFSDVKHQLLTASNEEQEAAVIANGGRAGAFTLTTPKGGRGVHFALGGKVSTVAASLEQEGMSPAEAKAEAERRVRAERERLDSDEIKGLLVLGFEHHDSRRRDDQLRGRAARQGERGASRFYASLEDAFFMGADIPSWITEALSDPVIRREGLAGEQVQAFIDEHQRRREARAEGGISEALPYDSVLERQRERLLLERDRLADHDDLSGWVRDLVRERIETLVDTVTLGQPKGPLSAAALLEVHAALAELAPLTGRTEPPPSWVGLDRTRLKTRIQEQLAFELEKLLTEVGEAGVRAFALQTAAIGFSEHLEDLTSLRETIHFETPVQKDPRLEYVSKVNESWTGLVEGERRYLADQVLADLPPTFLS